MKFNMAPSVFFKFLPIFDGIYTKSYRTEREQIFTKSFYMGTFRERDEGLMGGKMTRKQWDKLQATQS